VNGTQSTPAEALQLPQTSQPPNLQTTQSREQQGAAQPVPSFAPPSRPQPPIVAPIEKSRPASRLNNAPIQQQQDASTSRPAQAESQSALPSSLEDLLVSFEGAKQKGCFLRN
jgi:hypothetical protein